MKSSPIHPNFAWKIVLALFCLATMIRASQAHPMGNFSINHYARLEAGADHLALRYILDFAEISTAERMAEIDRDGNNQVSNAEKSRYSQAQSAILRRGLSLTIDGQRAAFSLRPIAVRLTPGAGGLPTMHLLFESKVPWPAVKSQTHRIVYRDTNFEARTGWKEIVTTTRIGAALQNSDAAARDISRELTVFPTDSGRVAPSQTEATFSVKIGAINDNGATVATSKSSDGQAPGDSKYRRAPENANRTPQNGFTQTIAAGNLTPGVMALGVLVALAFGAAHALSPGHGKTMVAAYLVGTRGTPRHAALLGVVVTITHTFGVFLLGFITLFAAQYIVPERLYPVLSAVSGILILGIGFWLLLSRVQDLQHHRVHDHDHSHEDHTHDHDHAAGHVHSHGGRAHSHAIPEGPVTTRTLIGLGIAGGIVPCPEALVVLLAAIKMQRIGYGMLLIGAFSIGLAAALIAIGLTVVAARRHLSRWENLPVAGALTRYLPIGSAAIITVIGVLLTLQAVIARTP